MKRTKILLAAVALCLGIMPTFPAEAANGEIACNNLINDNGYSVISRRGGEPVYNNDGIVGYRYLYGIRNNHYGRDQGYGRDQDYRRDQGYGRDQDYRRDQSYGRDQDYRRDQSYGRDQGYVACVWNARRNSARLIYR